MTESLLRTHCDCSYGDAVITAVIDALADAKGVSPVELDPLYDSIDPDALSRLLSGADADLRVTFTHGQHRVQVSADGTITVRAVGDGDTS
jgi:hypothetical protein